MVKIAPIPVKNTEDKIDSAIVKRVKGYNTNEH